MRGAAPGRAALGRPAGAARSDYPSAQQSHPHCLQVQVPVSQQRQHSQASHTVQVSLTPASQQAAGTRDMAAQSIIAIMGNLLGKVENGIETYAC